MLSVLIRITSSSEAILMGMHNIQFYDKVRKLPLNILSYREEFRRDSKTSSN